MIVNILLRVFIVTACFHARIYRIGRNVSIIWAICDTIILLTVAYIGFTKEAIFHEMYYVGTSYTLLAISIIVHKRFSPRVKSVKDLHRTIHRCVQLNHTPNLTWNERRELRDLTYAMRKFTKNMVRRQVIKDEHK